MFRYTRAGSSSGEGRRDVDLTPTRGTARLSIDLSPAAVTDASNRPGFERRSRAYSIAIVAALLATVIATSVVAGKSRTPAAGLGSDYPAFYGAARIAADGDWEHLYDLDRQVAAQADLQTEPGTARYFPYPPQVALVYRPLASLDYHWSYLVHTILMGVFLSLAVLIVRPMVPWLTRWALIAVAGSLLFLPTMRAIVGGSNVALSLLLIATAWRLVHDGHEFAAGLALSLLLFKPQYAVPLIGLFVIARYWRVGYGALAGGSLFYALGAALQGPGWGASWVENAVEFGAMDAEVNGFSAVSFVGVFANTLGNDAIVAGWALAIATATILAWLWARSDRAGLDTKLALTMPGLLLMSPHAVNHDTALLLISVAVVVGSAGIRSSGPWIGAIWVLGAGQAVLGSFGIRASLGFAAVIVTAWLAWRLLGKAVRAPDVPTAPIGEIAAPG